MMHEQKYRGVFDIKRLRYVYIPSDDSQDYYMLNLSGARHITRHFKLNRLIVAGGVSFVFFKEIFFFVGLLVASFFLLGTNRAVAKKLHLLLPVIHYEKMSEGEKKRYIKEKEGNKHTSYHTEDEVQDPSKIQNALNSASDSLFGKKPEPELKIRNTPPKVPESVIMKQKSIFDDYESVMDKFDSKKSQEKK